MPDAAARLLRTGRCARSCSCSLPGDGGRIFQRIRSTRCSSQSASSGLLLGASFAIGFRPLQRSLVPRWQTLRLRASALALPRFSRRGRAPTWIIRCHSAVREPIFWSGPRHAAFTACCSRFPCWRFAGRWIGASIVSRRMRCWRPPQPASRRTSHSSFTARSRTLAPGRRSRERGPRARSRIRAPSRRAGPRLDPVEPMASRGRFFNRQVAKIAKSRQGIIDPLTSHESVRDYRLAAAARVRDAAPARRRRVRSGA